MDPAGSVRRECGEYGVESKVCVQMAMSGKHGVAVSINREVG